MRGLIIALFLALAAPALILSPAVGQTVADPVPEQVDNSLWSRIESGFTQGAGREPQLMIVAAILGGLLPVVSLFALASRFGFKRWTARKPEAFTQVDMAPAVTRQQVSEIRGQLPLLDVIGQDADVHRIDGNMTRIGRHEENDIRLASQTVHRYHAVLHRTPEQKFVITDLSGPEGNGVVVNAERVDQIALAAGDLIELGDVRMRFRFGEAH